ncbi:MAG: PHP domain-containing protein [Terriglobia bacterium]
MPPPTIVEEPFGQGRLREITMQELIHGAFHFHSTYSHDGKSGLREIASSLSRRGLSFCVMTEHFEDLNAAKLDRYVREANEVTQNIGFLLIPGAEVDLSGLHTIVCPVRSYGEISRMRWPEEADPRVLKVLAHPSKYRFELVRDHLERYKINGLELWNQEADSRYIPPLSLLARLSADPRRSRLRYFFGCDLHRASLTVANIISLPAPHELTAEAIVSALLEGDFVTRNTATGIEYHNRSESDGFGAWAEAVLRRPFYRARLRRSARRCLRSCYRMLSPRTQHSLNDIKNFVRNKV